MICDLDDDIIFFVQHKKHPCLHRYSVLHKNTLHSIHSSCGATVPTFTTVSDCNLPWQLLSSETFPTASSGITAHKMFGVLESRVHETNVINVGWVEMSKIWVGFWGS